MQTQQSIEVDPSEQQPAHTQKPVLNAPPKPSLRKRKVPSLGDQRPTKVMKQTTSSGRLTEHLAAKDRTILRLRGKITELDGQVDRLTDDYGQVLDDNERLQDENRDLKEQLVEANDSFEGDDLGNGQMAPEDDESDGEAL